MNKFFKETEFRETTIGKYPRDWEISKLENLIILETGKRAKGGALKEGNVASIGGEHIDSHGNVLWDNMKFIPEFLYESLNQGKVNLNDILMVKDGATTGKTAFIKNLKYNKVAVNEHVFIIRSKTDLVNKYLFYILFSKIGQEQIKTRFHGLIGGVIRNDLETILVPLPVIQEQQAITQVLTVIDEAIQKINEILDKTNQLKKGLMKELLTKGIGNKDYKETELGKIPKTWQTMKLGKVLDLCQYGLSFKFGEEGKYRILKMDDISNGVAISDNAKYIDLDEKIFNNFKLQKGDILFNRTNSYEYVGRTGIFLLEGDYTFASYLIRLRPKKDVIDSQFLTFYLTYSSNRLKQLATRAVHQANINATNLQNFVISVPPLLEQQKIAKAIVSVDRKLENERFEKQELEKIKQGIMDLLLTGTVRIKAS